MHRHFLPASTARILVVGDLILDRYVYGETTRISPEAPVPIVKVITTEEKPGGAANVALNIRALGLDVELIGITGADSAAEILSEKLTEQGIKCRFVQQAGFPTVTKLRILSQHQQLLRLDYEAASTVAEPAPLYELYRQSIENVDVVILSDYAKGSLQMIGDFITLAREKNIRLLVDPKGHDYSRYSQASILTPNLKEFEAVVGTCHDEHEIVEKGTALCHSLSLDALCITRGENGMSLINVKDDKVVHLPAQAHEVFDVTGAGDTVIATLAAAMASGYGLEESLIYANQAAGLVVEKLGTATVTSQELNSALQQTDPIVSGITTRQDLSGLVASARAQGQKIVMTNGCFDILHAGHVYYLQEARACGDFLLVAVNDDASVKRLKGSNRPINPVEQRMAVLAGLASVNWVTSFSEDTPEQLIKIIKPDVLVKGGDYTAEQIVGAEFVRNNGGEVRIIPFQKNCSSSEIIRSIQALENGLTE